MSAKAIIPSVRCKVEGERVRVNYELIRTEILFCYFLWVSRIVVGFDWVKTAISETVAPWWSDLVPPCEAKPIRCTVTSCNCSNAFILDFDFSTSRVGMDFMIAVVVSPVVFDSDFTAIPTVSCHESEITVGRSVTSTSLCV